MMNWISDSPWIVAYATVAVWIVAGAVVQYIVKHLVRRTAERATWGGGDTVVHAIGWSIVVWCAIIGSATVLDDLPLNKRAYAIVSGVLLVLTVLTAAIVITRLANALMRFWAARAEAAVPGVSIITTLVSIAVYITAALIALHSFGISITPVLTALGVGGLAVALALQDTLSNLFAGFHLIMSGQIRPGDFVKLSSGEEGFVTDVAWRNTTMRALSDVTIIIPNAKLATSILTNTHLPGSEMNVTIDIGVRYGSDLTAVEKIASEVARDVVGRVPGAVATFEPLVRFHTFADSGVKFVVIIRVAEFAQQFALKHELIKMLDVRFREAGIEMPVMRVDQALGSRGG